MPELQDGLCGLPVLLAGHCSIWQTVTARIKARTEHLKGVKDCHHGLHRNGPGEMADADFGYVGGAPRENKNLYGGQEANLSSISRKAKPWSAWWT